MKDKIICIRIYVLNYKLEYTILSIRTYTINPNRKYCLKRFLSVDIIIIVNEIQMELKLI